jgi:hypothetical protein
MMRAALPRVTISEYFAYRKNLIRPARRRRRNRLSGQRFAAQAFFSLTNDRLHRTRLRIFSYINADGNDSCGIGITN